MKSESKTFNYSSMDELYSILKPSIDKLYKEYDYMAYTYDEFKLLIEDSLKSITKVPENVNRNFLCNYLEKYLRKTINHDISLKILSDNGYIYVLNYIDTHYYESDDYTELFGQFQNFCAFFEQIKCCPTVELLIDLLHKSSLLNKIIARIVSENMRIIQLNQLETAFKSENSLLIIQAYCILYPVDKADDDIENDIESKVGTNTYTDNIVMEYLSKLAPKLSAEEETKLCLKIKNGDQDAKKKFITHNLRLVVSIARRYVGRGLDFPDLIQEGNIGLMNAVDRYDISTGYKFSTYATWWIRQAISRAIRTLGRNVRIPSYCYDKLNQYNKAVAHLKNQWNRDPSPDEIANYLDISNEELLKLYELRQDTISINNKIGDDEETEIGDFIKDESVSIEQSLMNKNLSDEINKLLEHIPQRLSIILIYRYGLDGNEPKTLAELSKMFGISRERVRQLENAALERIRISPYIKDFAVYMQKPDQALDTIEQYNREYLGTKKDKDLKHAEKEKKTMAKKIQTIYELLSNYPKDLINQVLNTLDEEEQKIVVLSYGEDLEHPMRSKQWNSETNSKFYYNILPKIKRKLAKLLDEKANPCKTIYELLPAYSEDVIDNAIQLLNSDDRMLLLLANGRDLKHPIRDEKWNQQYEKKYMDGLIPKVERLAMASNSDSKSDIKDEKKDATVESNLKNKLTKAESDSTDTNSSNAEGLPMTKQLEKLDNQDDYLSILKMLKTPMFSQLMNELNAKEAVIVSLKLGYVDEKYFSSESIAEFLQIQPEEVTDTIKRVLLTYRDYLNKYINKAINLIDDQEKIYKK